MNTVVLSVVIPCFDEMANLRKGVLDKIEHFLGRKNYTYEVIIVDDGSTDGSVEFVEQFTQENPNFKLIKSTHTGKAGAVTKGMLSAKGVHVLFADMDQATPIEELDKLLPYFQKGYDVVIGSRNSKRRGSPLSRLVISRANILLRKLIVGMNDISDTQCGFKAFSHECAQKIFSKIRDIHHGFSKIHGSSVTSGFDVELLFLAQKLGFSLKEVPVSWLYVETRRVNPIRDSIEGLLELFRIRKNIARGRYD